VSSVDEILIVGGGICGLTLALNLHKRGIPCRVFERAPEMKELGVGITLLPHGMREFMALGLQERLLQAGIENSESRFYRLFISGSRHSSRPLADAALRGGMRPSRRRSDRAQSHMCRC
jgi:2-polyprenyl-6-methoxyphenol hydroxylase-like FAD-dependent oxidoreductase